jgi:aspartate aminotransferase
LHIDGLEQHVILLDTISKRYVPVVQGCALVTKNKAVYDSAMKFAQARLSRGPGTDHG